LLMGLVALAGCGQAFAQFLPTCLAAPGVVNRAGDVKFNQLK